MTPYPSVKVATDAICGLDIPTFITPAATAFSVQGGVSPSLSPCGGLPDGNQTRGDCATRQAISYYPLLNTKHMIYMWQPEILM